MSSTSVAAATTTAVDSDLGDSDANITVAADTKDGANATTGIVSTTPDMLKENAGSSDSSYHPPRDDVPNDYDDDDDDNDATARQTLGGGEDEKSNGMVVALAVALSIIGFALIAAAMYVVRKNQHAVTAKDAQNRAAVAALTPNPAFAMMENPMRASAPEVTPSLSGARIVDNTCGGLGSTSGTVAGIGSGTPGVKQAAGASRRAVGKSAQCERPAPKGGTCTTLKLNGGNFCIKHCCTQPGCKESKSGSEVACPVHMDAHGGGGGDYLVPVSSNPEYDVAKEAAGGDYLVPVSSNPEYGYATIPTQEPLSCADGGRLVAVYAIPIEDASTAA